MKKEKKILVYELQFGDQTMYTQDMEDVLEDAKIHLSYIGVSVRITASLRTKKWWKNLNDWDGWRYDTN